MWFEIVIGIVLFALIVVGREFYLVLKVLEEERQHEL